MNETIEILIDEEKVQGRFTHRSATIIEVEILSPYDGFRKELRMPVFSKTTVPDGLIGAEGNVQGERLLRELHTLCRFLDRHRPTLVDAYRSFRTRLREIRTVNAVDDEALSGLQRLMRDELKTGSIDEAEFLKRMTSIRLEHSNHHFRAYRATRAFFRTNFPFKVPDQMQNQVLTYLERASRP